MGHSQTGSSTEESRGRELLGGIGAGHASTEGKGELKAVAWEVGARQLQKWAQGTEFLRGERVGKKNGK